MIKKYILDSCIKSIRKNCPQYNEEKLLEIRYGLEGIYLTITKAIIIFSLAGILNIFKEMFIILILYNSLRMVGFGLHAKKAWMCLMASLTMFILSPILAINVTIPLGIKILLIAICIISFYLYAPADTEKRPLIKKEKRDKFKFSTVLVAIIFSFISLYTKNNFLSNALILAMIIETIMILPFTYKIFKLPYNNYKTYIMLNS